MNTKEVNSYHENALHQAIKKHTPTKRDPSFYSWYERDPATLNVIEKRTARVGSSPDAVTKAAQFKKNICHAKSKITPARDPKQVF